MIKRTATKSPKKVDAPGLFIDLECETKHLEQSLQSWNEDLLIIARGLENCERAVRNELTLASSDLGKEYNTAHTKMTRLNKAVESTQKKLNKIQTEFEKKILTPSRNGEFASQSQAVLDEIAENTRKITLMSATNKSAMDEIIERSSDYTRRLAMLETSINELCLPEELEDASKASVKLTERIEAICTATAALDQGTTRSASDTQKLEKPLLQLYAAQQRRTELLDQMKINLGMTTLIPSVGTTTASSTGEASSQGTGTKSPKPTVTVSA